MRQLIKGRIYNTETAEYIASFSQGSPGDFAAMGEDLYRTKKGRWFIHGSGGPASKYSVQLSDNECSGSSRIIPLSDAGALKWCEKRAIDVDKIIEYFGEMQEA